MEIHRLTADEHGRLRSIRLRALTEAPGAFGTTFEQAASWPSEVWRGQLTGLAAFVAVVGDTDVGLVRGRPDASDEGSARLSSLWVVPQARGTGVGASLIDTVVGWARSQGFRQLRLGVNDDNAEAIALYARKGFEPSGEVGTLPPPRDHLGKHDRILKLL